MMYCKCDGCGQEAPAVFTGTHWLKPRNWYQRDVSVSRHNYGEVNEAGSFEAPTVLLICSLGCATLVVEKFSKFLTL